MPRGMFCTFVLLYNDMRSDGVYREYGVAAWRPAAWVPRQWEQRRTESLIRPCRHKAAGGILPIREMSEGMTIRYRDGVTWRISGARGDGTGGGSWGPDELQEGYADRMQVGGARKWGEKGEEGGMARESVSTSVGCAA